MLVKVYTRGGDMSTLSRVQTDMAIAHIIAMRGSCRRAKVGCVITRDHRIISTGYNGSLLYKKCLECDISKKCKDAVHAEANAIAFAAKEGIRLNGATLYCTHAPCYECAKLIHQVGIKDVIYEELYETDKAEGIIFLNAHNISAMRYEDQK
jgi:dCMP deaminase